MKDVKEFIKLNEGFRPHPYQCSAGKITIGYGRNLTDVGVSEIEANILLCNDILEAEHAVMRVIGFIQNENLRCAMVDMMFNLGETRFKKFKKMIAAVKAGNINHIAHHAVTAPGTQKGESKADAAMVVGTAVVGDAAGQVAPELYRLDVRGQIVEGGLGRGIGDVRLGRQARDVEVHGDTEC